LTHFAFTLTMHATFGLHASQKGFSVLQEPCLRVAGLRDIRKAKKKRIS
jgi:hypothetical protein